MKLDYDVIMEKANLIYAVEKLKQSNQDPRYLAPELMPKIVSWQVKAILNVLIDEINKQMEEITDDIIKWKEKIRELENENK